MFSSSEYSCTEWISLDVLTYTHIWLRMSSRLCATNGLLELFGEDGPGLGFYLWTQFKFMTSVGWWCHMTLTPALRKQRQAGFFWGQGQPGPQREFQNSQGCYSEKPCLGGKKIHQYTWPVAAQMVCPGYPWLAKHNSYVCLSSQNSKPVTLSVCSGCCVKTQWTGYLISQNSGSPESKFKELANWIPGEGPVPGLSSCLLSLVQGGNSGVSLRKTQKPSLEPHPQGLIGT